jgi:RNA-binding protein YhbY
LQGVVAGEEDELLDLPMPDTRHQRQLDMKAIKALRSRANTAAKEKTLINVQVWGVGGWLRGLRAINSSRLSYTALDTASPFSVLLILLLVWVHVMIQVGQNGITQAVLSTCADVLSKHELVRVRLGEGCGLERGSAARQLASLLDAVCVHQIGFTVSEWSWSVH